MANNDKAQQDFSKGALDGIQTLIGRMDLKAGIVLTLVGLLSAALYALSGSLLGRVPTVLCHQFLLSVLAVYFLFMTYILWQTTSVFIARPASVGNFSKAPLMLYPLLILKTFKSDKDYAERAANLSHDDILADYANQIMECSNIYKLKHEYVNKSVKALAFLLLPWFIFVVTATSQIFLYEKSKCEVQGKIMLEDKTNTTPAKKA